MYACKKYREFLMFCRKSLLQVVPGHSSVLYTVTTLSPPRYSFGAAGRPGTGSQCILALVHWCQEISAGVLTCFKADTPLPWGPEAPLGYTGKSLNCKTWKSAWGIFKMNSQTTPDPGGGITCCDYPTKDDKKRRKLKTIQDPCLIPVLLLTVRFSEKYFGT